MSYKVFYDDTSFRLKGWRKTEKIISRIIATEKKVSGNLIFIITSSKNLRKINTEFLKHNFDTDIITFNYNVKNVVNGEIYISIETVKENAINYNVSLKSEISRVLFHGVLHLVGYDDKTEKEKIRMNEMEDFWLMKMADE